MTIVWLFNNQTIVCITIISANISLLILTIRIRLFFLLCSFHFYPRKTMKKDEEFLGKAPEA